MDHVTKDVYNMYLDSDRYYRIYYEDSDRYNRNYYELVAIYLICDKTFPAVVLRLAVLYVVK